MGVSEPVFHSDANVVAGQTTQRTLFSGVTFETGKRCFRKSFRPK